LTRLSFFTFVQLHGRTQQGSGLRGAVISSAVALLSLGFVIAAGALDAAAKPPRHRRTTATTVTVTTPGPRNLSLVELRLVPSSTSATPPVISFGKHTPPPQLLFVGKSEFLTDGSVLVHIELLDRGASGHLDPSTTLKVTPGWLIKGERTSVNALTTPNPSFCLPTKKKVKKRFVFFSDANRRDRRPTPGEIRTLARDSALIGCGDHSLLAPENIILGNLGGGVIGQAAGGATLTITINGTGSGTVIDNHGGVDVGCKMTCTVNFPSSTTPLGGMITLAGQPDSGSVFSGWGGDCSGAGACVVTMNANHAVTATFDKTGPAAACTTKLTNQGALHEVISNTTCGGGLHFNALRFMPPAGNSFTNFFAENGQANCSLQNPYLVCSFPEQATASGPIDLRGSSTPSGITIQRSTDGGATWGPATWTSTGP
jgi:hypothetical protein